MKLSVRACLLLVAGGTAGVAQADSDVTLYGFIDTGLAVTSNTGDGSQTTVQAQDSILGVSNVGFKASQDVGDQASVFMNLQTGFNPSNGQTSGGNGFFTRNAYVGIKTTAGSFSAGKQWDFNDDWLVGSVFLGGYNSGCVFKFSEFDAVSDLYNRTLKYVSPTVEGTQFGLFYSFGGKPGSIAAGQIYNVAAQYDDGPLHFAFTYFHEQDSGSPATATSLATATNGTTYGLTSAGASYDFGTVKARLGLSYADIDGPGGTFQSLPSNISTRKAYAVEPGLTFVLDPKFNLYTDIVYRDDTTLSNHSTVYRLLGIYQVYKNTALLANLAHLTNSGGATESLFATNSGLIGGGYANKSQTSLAVGVRFVF